MQKKERAIKQKQRQDMLLKKDFQNPHYSGNTRSCHARRPISYTFGKMCVICSITWHTHLAF